MYTIKNDRYQKTRGGNSRILDVTCEHCGHHVCFYQKDGPGNLRRMYTDRMIDLQIDDKILSCGNCRRELGVRIIWQKENRPAYRLFVESVKKKRASKESV